MKFSDRLKQLRTERNVTQTELANYIGVTKSTVSMYENDSRKPSFEVLEAIADYFNISMSSLTEYKEEEPQGYYTDPEAAEYAEYARTNPNIRVLFSAAKNISKKDMEKAVEYIQFLKSKERNDYTFSDDISDGDFIDDVADDNFSE